MSPMPATVPKVGLDHAARDRSLAAALALLVVATGWLDSVPLPVLGWAAAFVLLAVFHDLRERRIPNAVTFTTLAVALLHGLRTGGADGLLDAFVGGLAPLAMFILPYAAGGLGAGDVKAAMALGALLGPVAAVQLVLLSIAIGGAWAFGRLLRAGELSACTRRIGESIFASFATRRWAPIPAPPGSAAAHGLPFAVALSLALSARSVLGVTL
jgi:prepilin peptidase CpaA